MTEAHRVFARTEIETALEEQTVDGTDARFARFGNCCQVEHAYAAQHARQVGGGHAAVGCVNAAHVRTDARVGSVEQLLQFGGLGGRLVHAKEATDGNLRFAATTRPCYMRSRH